MALALYSSSFPVISLVRLGEVKNFLDPEKCPYKILIPARYNDDIIGNCRHFFDGEIDKSSQGNVLRLKQLRRCKKHFSCLCRIHSHTL